MAIKITLYLGWGWVELGGVGLGSGYKFGYKKPISAFSGETGSFLGSYDHLVNPAI